MALRTALGYLVAPGALSRVAVLSSLEPYAGSMCSRCDVMSAVTAYNVE